MVTHPRLPVQLKGHVPNRLALFDSRIAMLHTANAERWRVGDVTIRAPRANLVAADPRIPRRVAPTDFRFFGHIILGWLGSDGRLRLPFFSIRFRIADVSLFHQEASNTTSTADRC